MNGNTTSMRERKRPCLLTALGLILVFGFFFAVMLLLHGGGGIGGTDGSGTGRFGDGSGAGTDGSGRGYGSSGSGITAGQGNGPGSGSRTEKKKAGTEDGQEKQDVQLTDGSKDGEAGVNERLQAEDEYRAMAKVPTQHSIEQPQDKTKTPHQKTLLPEVTVPVPATPRGSTKSSGSGSSGLSGKAGFFGVKTQGNVLFVVDVSGSMADQSSEGIRIELLKRQLKNAIRLKKGKKYAVIAFSSGFIRYPAEEKKMCKFSDGLTKDVEKFVDSLIANGGTGLLAALQAQEATIKKEEIETIFLLTDGEPDTPWNVILEYIEKNIPKKIKINTVSIGRECPEMETLSKNRKGTHVVVK